MRLEHPIQALSDSCAHAAFVALAPVSYFQRDRSINFTVAELQRRREIERTDGIAKAWPGQFVDRRPRSDEIEVLAMFSQTWGSTALGFGGLGGAAMTPAYTVALQGPERDVAIYFRGQFAYRIDPKSSSPEQLAAFRADLAAMHVCGCSAAAQRYGAAGEYSAPGTPEPIRTRKPAP